MRTSFVVTLMFIVCVLTYPSQTYAQYTDPGFVERIVRAFFKNIPEMIEIARCESAFRQNDNSGGVLKGGYGGDMIGIYQIYGDVHRSQALSMGYDIDTVLGNISYAKYLYDQQGTTPWISSSSCWLSNLHSVATVKTAYASEIITPNQLQASISNTTPETKKTRTPKPILRGTVKQKTYLGRDNPRDKKNEELTISPLSASMGTFTKYLAYMYADEEVRRLQQALNNAGFTVSASGPGSPGRETDLFGPLTVRALTRFQCAKNIACPSLGNIQGYGVVDAKTRAVLNGMI